MNKQVIQMLMLECGLIPISHHRWDKDHFVHVDDFIDGDSASLMQFADELLKREREANARLCEDMGIEGYGTLAIAAAIRSKNTQGK